MILFEARALSAPPAGVNRYLVGLLRGLRHASPDLPLTLLVDQPRALRRVPGFQGVAVGPAHPLLRLYWDAFAVRSVITRLRPRLVHRTKPAGTFRPRGLPPIVMNVYDVIPLTHPGTQTLAQRTYWRMQLPRAARDAGHVLTISHDAKQSIVRMLDVPPDRITVTYPGIEESFQRPDAATIASVCTRYGLDGPYLLHVGTIEPRKNVDLLLKAFADIAERVPHNVVLAGRWGWKGEAVRAAARDPRMANRVRFLGPVPHGDLAALYAGASAVAFLSSAEGFGFPPLEAMACGTPTVVSRRGSLPEVVGGAALIVEPDRELVASAIERILGDASLRERLSAAGPVRARTFTWGRCATETLRVYEQVLGEPMLVHTPVSPIQHVTSP